MIICNKTERVINVFNSAFEDSVGMEKTLTIPDEALENDKILNFCYLGTKSSETELDWEEDTYDLFEKKPYIRWKHIFHVPVTVSLDTDTVDHDGIVCVSDDISDSITLLLPTVVLHKVK